VFVPTVEHKAQSWQSPTTTVCRAVLVATCGLSSAARLVAIALAELYVNRGTWSSQARPDGPPGPSLPTISAVTKLSVRTVNRAISELSEAGIFAVDGGSRPGARRSNRYRLLLRRSDDPRHLGTGAAATRARFAKDPRQRAGMTRATLASKPITDEPTIEPEAPDRAADEKWVTVLEAARANPSISAWTLETYFSTARPRALQGDELTIEMPSKDHAEFLRGPVGRVARGLGVVVVLTWPGWRRAA